MPLPRGSDPIFLAFEENARFVDGVPVNFSGLVSPAPLIVHLEYSPIRHCFRHMTLNEAIDRDAFFVIGLQGSPYEWLGLSDNPPMPAAFFAPLRRLLREHPRLRLLVDYSAEGGLLGDLFDRFGDACFELGIDHNRVTFIVSNSGLEIAYAEYLARSKKNARETYSIVGIDAALLWFGIRFARWRIFHGDDSLMTIAEAERLSTTVRSKKFLALNRRLRWQRLMLALMIERLGLRPSGLISMPSLQFEGDWYPDLDTSHEKVRRYGSSMDAEVWAPLEQSIEATYATLPWTIDFDVDHSGGTTYKYAIDLQLKHQSEAYVQIITETEMEGRPCDIFITEKVCKSLAYMQPFVVFGNYRLIAKLIEYGFEETFPRVSQYDIEIDVARRLNSLFHELANLASLSIDDLHDHYYKNLGSLVHNRQRLFAMPKLIGEILVSKLRASLR
jgi:hypothetical protein